MSHQAMSLNTTSSISQVAALAGPRKVKIKAKRKSMTLSPARLAYFVFLLVNLVLFIRPSELIPALQGTELYEMLILGALLLNIKNIQPQLRYRELRKQPIVLCAVGLIFAIMLSHATHFYLGGVVEGAEMFFKVLVYFILLVSLITTPQRLKWFAMTVALSASLMITFCVVDYLGIHDFKFITHVVDQADDYDEITGQRLRVVRMRGTGLFQDPNDIGLLIVTTSILCTYFLTDKSLPGFRFGWIVPLLIMFVALYCTRSRGALLSLGVAGLSFCALRFGKKMAIAGGIIALLGATLVAGRQANIDLEDGTGQDRILIWREGLLELRSPDILFGAGEGMYDEIANFVAHNSFVHTYVELGLFGGTLFFGCFFFAGVALYKMSLPTTRILHPELERFRPYMGAIVGGMGIGLMALSRCYVVPTYMVIGMATTYISIVNRHCTPRKFLIYWNKHHITLLLTGSACMFVVLHVLVKVLAH